MALSEGVRAILTLGEGVRETIKSQEGARVSLCRAQAQRTREGTDGQIGAEDDRGATQGSGLGRGQWCLLKPEGEKGDMQYKPPSHISWNFALSEPSWDQLEA